MPTNILNIINKLNNGFPLDDAEKEALSKFIESIRKSLGISGSSLFGISSDERYTGYIGTTYNGNSYFSRQIGEKRKEVQELYKDMRNILEDSTKSIEEQIEAIAKYHAAAKEVQKLEEKINEELSYQNKLQNEGVTLEEKITHFLKEQANSREINYDRVKNGANELKSGFGKMKSEFSGLVSLVKDFVSTWGKIDQAAYKYGKTIGGNAKSMEALRKNTINFVEDSKIGIKYNTSAEELIQMQEKYNSSIGRSVVLTNEQLENVAGMKAVMGEDVAVDFASKFENFGLDADSAAELSGEMFANASKHGVVFEKYSKSFLENIKLAQNYSFTNGVKGLSSMAEKSTAVKLNMQQVAAAADKLSTVEGSIQAAAQLSVLGGPFAAYSNPMSLLNESLNDMEGLQDRIVNMFGSLGKWNSEKGMVDIGSFNKQRVKAASEAMGVSYGDIMDMINEKGRINIVKEQMKNSDLSRLNDDTKKLIENTAQLDSNGKAYVNVNGQKKSLSAVTNADADALEKNAQSESDDIKDIATMLRGWDDIMQGTKKQWENTKAFFSERLGLGKGIKKFTEWFGSTTGLLQGILVATTSISAMMLTGGILKGIGGMFNGIGNMYGGFRGKGFTPMLPTQTISPTGAPIMAPRSMPSMSQMQKVIKSSGNTSIKGGFNVGKNMALARGQNGTLGGIKGALSTTAGSAIAGGAIAGIATGIDEFAGSNKNRHTTGEKWWTTGGSAAGAALGTLLFPGVGTIIGGIAGGLIGKYAGAALGEAFSTKEGIRELANKNGLGELQGVKNGVYSPSDIRKMIDGEIDAELQSKMVQFGDDVRYMNLRNGGTGQQYKNGRIPKYPNGNLKPDLFNNVKESIMPNIYGGVSIAKGKSHREGGITANIGGKISEIEGGEAVISKSKTSQYLPELKAINEGTLPKIFKNGSIPKLETGKITPTGNKLGAMKVKTTDAPKSVTPNVPSKISIEPLEVNINGTLKLDLGGKISNVDIDKLLDNNTFKQEIAKLIMKEMPKYVNNRGNVKEETFRQQMANTH